MLTASQEGPQMSEPGRDEGMNLGQPLTTVSRYINNVILIHFAFWEVS